MIGYGEKEKKKKREKKTDFFKVCMHTGRTIWKLYDLNHQ